MAFLVLLQATGFIMNHSENVRSFWQENYLAVKTVNAIKTLAIQEGYSCIADFSLPASAWWDDY
jgi:CO dehydrogenase/acetyl-CoA synthase epsilon subunit